LSLPWDEPSWRSEVERWIDAALKASGQQRSGPSGEPPRRPWSAVIRVPLEGGDAYFKAVPASLRHEAGLTARLAEWFPDIVVPVLAVDEDRGWLLMPDAGEEMRDALTPVELAGAWPDVLRRYARLQAACAGRIDDLLALGVPDRRLRHVDALLDEALAFAEQGTRGADEPPTVDEWRRLNAALPSVKACAKRLAALGLPETIQHDDLHPGNVLWGERGSLLFDWGTAVVTHPFISLRMLIARLDDRFLSTMEGTPAETRPALAAYLEPWTAFAPMDSLLRAYEDSVVLGLVLRFLMWETVLAAATEQQRARGANSVVRLLRTILGLLGASFNG
jgi:hypothetical protein